MTGKNGKIGKGQNEWTIMKYNQQKVNYLKVLFLNLFSPLPFTGFTDFTGKLHYFYHFTSKFKTR